MAKEIKVFNGVINSGGVIYTVPAGRVAKVEFASFTFASGSSLAIGASPQIMNSTGNLITVPSAIKWSTSNINTIAMLNSSECLVGTDTATNASIISVPRISFLTAGQNISSATGFMLYYSFSVVEEY